MKTFENHPLKPAENMGRGIIAAYGSGQDFRHCSQPVPENRAFDIVEEGVRT